MWTIACSIGSSRYLSLPLSRAICSSHGVGSYTRRYETLLTGLRAMTALLVLRDKAIKPLLAAAQPLRPKRGAHNPKPINLHYDAIQVAMKDVFHELGLAA